MRNGGIERFVMNYYRRIDRREVQFDFLTSVAESGYFDEEIRSLGGRLFRAYPFKKNPLKNYLSIAQIVKENNFQIVHRHTGSAFGYFDLRAARRGGANNLILHAHNTNVGVPFIHFLAQKTLRVDCRRFACSREAGSFLFGSNNDCEIIRNAVDLNSFIFRPEVREKIRQRLEIDGKLVVGHIGRFDEQKNHKRLLTIFSEILKRRKKAVLVCVGDGAGMFEAKRLAIKLGVERDVLFLGQRDDVENVIQSFDAFLFPSLYEGLGMVLIEAQANGLKCFASKDVIPLDVNVSGNVNFVSLSSNDKEWANVILSADLTRDCSSVERIKDAGYDIAVEVQKLVDLYRSMAK